jgi:hypothetical protein
LGATAVTDFLEETHVQVAYALLTANPLFSPVDTPTLGLIGVYDGVSPNHPTPDPPYVLIYARVSWPRDGLGTALDGLQDTARTTLTCHCVGLTAQAARVVHMQVRGTLLNAKPMIAGRICSPIKDAGADETIPVRDESTGRLVVDMVAEYDFYSTG